MNFIFHVSILLAASMILCTSTANAWRHTWPDLHIPRELESKWIAKDLQHNGIDMKIVRMFGPWPAEKTLEYYSTHWAKVAKKPRVFGNDTQIVLSTIQKEGGGVFLIIKA